MVQTPLDRAKISAFVRAYRNEHDEHCLLPDPITRHLFTEEEYTIFKRTAADKASVFLSKADRQEINEDQLIRGFLENFLPPVPVTGSKFYENILKNAINDGIEQCISIGAGFDSFPWREPDITEQIEIFEVDSPDVLEEKQRRLHHANLDIPEKLHFVPVLLPEESLQAALEKQGFNAEKKTILGWLGETCYLTDSQIRLVLEEISALAAPDSLLVLDHGDETLFRSEEPRVKNMLGLVRSCGRPMQFCCDSMYFSKLLEEYGFQIVEELDPDGANFHYLTGTSMTAFPHIHFTLARMVGKLPTKEKILQTALRLFAKRGYDAVSVRDIAGELGITQSALYRHYKSKQDIFDSILQRMEAERLERGKPDADLRTLILSSFRYWTQDPFAASFRKLLTVEQYHSPEMAALYQTYVSGGVLQQYESLFHHLEKEEARKNALALYGQVYLLMNLYDARQDKAAVYEILQKTVEDWEMYT